MSAYGEEFFPVRLIGPPLPKPGIHRLVESLPDRAALPLNNTSIEDKNLWRSKLWLITPKCDLEAWESLEEWVRAQPFGSWEDPKEMPHLFKLYDEENPDRLKHYRERGYRGVISLNQSFTSLQQSLEKIVETLESGAPDELSFDHSDSA